MNRRALLRSVALAVLAAGAAGGGWGGGVGLDC